MTTARKVGYPVKEIPVQGFSVGQEVGKYKDETKQEIMLLDLSGQDYVYCHEEHSSEMRGCCTRPKKSNGLIYEPHQGMHLAGDGDYIVGAW